MTAMLFRLVGGIGLFIMGMSMLTDGLRGFSGESLRQALMRFTGKPLKAFLSGALVTALVQSSSATIVMLIGFVSAGLLAFPQAVGVVIGASLGTTATSWIVATVGLKVSMGLYALPLVGAGAMIRSASSGRTRSLGLAVTGFGLIFLGIDTLQEGMGILAKSIQLASLPDHGLAGHLLAMLAGIVMTVMMQSSSAATTTTLTALHTNTINFDQAASLVIGAAIGTTVTGLFAAIDASTPARRTAMAHVVFNLATGLIAIAMLPVFMRGIRLAQQQHLLESGPVSLAAFHTAFILIGVLVFLPFVDRFAAAIERWLPDTRPLLTRHLDNSVLKVPEIAQEATRRALCEIACGMFDAARMNIAVPEIPVSGRQTQELQQALSQAHRFLERIPTVEQEDTISQVRLSLMHAMDHLARLQTRLTPAAPVQKVLSHPRLHDDRLRAQQLLRTAVAGLYGAAPSDWESTVENLSRVMADSRRQERTDVLRQTAVGSQHPGEALNLLDAMRWLDRISYHTWRICHYLAGAESAELTETTQADADADAGDDCFYSKGEYEG